MLLLCWLLLLLPIFAASFGAVAPVVDVAVNYALFVDIAVVAIAFVVVAAVAAVVFVAVA